MTDDTGCPANKYMKQDLRWRTLCPQERSEKLDTPVSMKSDKKIRQKNCSYLAHSCYFASFSKSGLSKGDFPPIWFGINNIRWKKQRTFIFKTQLCPDILAEQVQYQDFKRHLRRHTCITVGMKKVSVFKILLSIIEIKVSHALKVMWDGSGKDRW